MLDWLRRGKGASLLDLDRPLSSARYVVLDTELTSLDSRSNRLLSVGAIAMYGSTIVLGEQLYRVINPGVTVPERGVLIHRLRQADVASGQPPAEVLRELRTFIADAVLVGHFAEIDTKILRKELAVTDEELTNPAICTARVYRWILRKQHYTEDQFHRLENVDLPSLAKIYKIETPYPHHALADAFVTARLWQKLLSSLDTMGINTLGELLKIGRSG